ncbi:unnamed protein product [Calypogeia fissa]
MACGFVTTGTVMDHGFSKDFDGDSSEIGRNLRLVITSGLTGKGFGVNGGGIELMSGKSETIRDKRRETTTVLVGKLFKERKGKREGSAEEEEKNEKGMEKTTTKRKS